MSHHHTEVVRCYHGHQPLLIAGYKVYGGSCSSPSVTDADIYVGLDYSFKVIDKAYPWEEGHSFQYLINDMQAPKDAVSFIKLIEWLVAEIRLGKKVHIGCIGGHGRTGTVLAALVAIMENRTDAISYVRKHYCTKAVESEKQIEFLMKYFSQEKAAPSKNHIFSNVEKLPNNYKDYYNQKREIKNRDYMGGVHDVMVYPLKSNTSIWGKSLLLDKLN